MSLSKEELSKEALERIQEEEQVLEKTLDSLKKSYSSENEKFMRLAREARSLTSQIVNAARDVDKQLLANDESVSHSLSSRAKDESDTIEELIESPYFARIVIEEDSGPTKKIIEYKLGKKSHIDSSIIDWKNAPLAKLFYEYEEGESYLEDIRDRERSGIVLRKHKVKISESELLSLDCTKGRFKKNKNGAWESQSKGKISSEGKFELPSILSYITADQFRLITEDSSNPVILHGIAGSGKTSVALHRLTWQLAQAPEDASKGHIALVLTPTDILAQYIKNTLEKLEVTGVAIHTITDWISKVARESSLFETFKEKTTRVLPHHARIKLSIALVKSLFKTFHSFAPDSSTLQSSDLQNLYLKTLSNADLILENDLSNLIRREDVREVYVKTKENFSNGILDYCDELVLLLMEKNWGKANALPSYTHLFLDEFQDVTPVELSLIRACIKNKHAITMTGDIAQNTRDSQIHQATLEAFLLMDEHSQSSKDSVHTLSISHRSTLQIMKYADHIFGTNRTTDGRSGKPPLIILCDSQSHAVKELVSWIERVGKNYPGDPILLLSDTPANARHLYSLLKPSFDSAVSLLREAPRSTDGMILLASIQECKGLEFPHVMIWDVSESTYPKSPENKRKLYLATTRAEEHLAMIVWGQPSRLLPHIHSKLHRVYDTRREPEVPENS